MRQMVQKRSVCNSFDRKQEAEGWEEETKKQIKSGRFPFDHHKKLYTFHPEQKKEAPCFSYGEEFFQNSFLL